MYLPILHLPRVELRCKLHEKLHRVTWPLVQDTLFGAVQDTLFGAVQDTVKDTRKVKVLSLPETIKETSTFQAKALRRELVAGGRGKPRVLLYEQDACTGVHSACRREENGTIWIFVYYAVYGSGRGRCGISWS